MRAGGDAPAAQPFRFGGLVAIDPLFGANGEVCAATVGFGAFGLRASLLPCRWDLAISVSYWRRPAPQV